MKYIVVDTETTGLFKHRNEDGSVARSDALGQPRMVEFAAVLLDESFDVESTYQSYILPDRWQNADGSTMEEIPAEALAVHGLSMSFLYEHGKPCVGALDVYTRAVKEGRTVIGFNSQHDGRMVRAELRRAGMDDLFEQTPATCVMRSLQAAKLKIPKLNGKGGYPRLVDAAAYFGIAYDVSIRHQALDDAMCCALVAKAVHRLGHLLPGKVHYAADTPIRQEA